METKPKDKAGGNVYVTNSWMYRNDYAVVCRKRPPVFTAADRRETPTPSASVFAADLGMGNWERQQPCADTVCDHLRPNLRCKTASAYTIKEKWRGVDRIRISHVYAQCTYAVFFF
nr:hypothetical protein Iba_chr15aCG15020 [Ipomoea batatas]